VGKCLVLLPYDDDHNTSYSSTIEPTVAKHMISINLARLPSSEAIYTSFADNVRSASAIIADVTQLNPNVMYEIGWAHGSGATPWLYTRDAARLQDLPVYLKTLNIRLADETTPLEKLIDEYLGSVKAKRLSSLAQ
jgi:nucleoside 2-deoxyribosyltransferase